MLHLILGPAGTGKTGKIYEAVRERVAAGQPGAIFLVPEQYSHAAERELVARAGSAACLYAEVFSFTRLAGRVAEELGGGAKVALDEGGRVLTMRLAMNAVAGELKLYGHLGRKPEFLKGLLDTLDELKQCGLTPETLLDAAPWSEGSLGDKLRDLAYLLGAYDGISGRTDPRDALTRLADTIGESAVVKSAFFIDAFSDFTAQEQWILRRLLQKGADMTVALTCNGLDDENPIFAPAVVTVNRLRRLAEEQGHEVAITLCTPTQNRPEALSIVERYLFAEGESQGPDEHSSPLQTQSDAVELYVAATPLEECELAAARVRALVIDEGYRYRDIAVAARGFADYETVAEQVFARCGIPVHIARKTDILEKPILLLLTASLDILDGGWRFEAVFRYLRTGLTGITQREVDLLEGYVRMWNIHGSRWTRAADWKSNPAGYGADFGERETTELAQINQLRRRVSAPLAALEKAGRGVKTAAEQATAIYDFLEAIRLPQTLEERAHRLRASGRETLAAEYSQIWHILVSALEQSHAILGDVLMDQREFAALLRLTLSQYSVGAIPQTIDRVQLGELDRTRRRDLRCLIVLGATDMRLPAPASERGILTEPERERLRELGLALPDSAEERVYREEALIYHAFAAPRERLMVSWPRAKDEGGECRKSPIFTRLETILGQEAVSVSVILRRGAFNVLPVLVGATDPGRPLAETDANGEGHPPTEVDRGDRGRPPLQERALSTHATRRLYGERLNLSASRIETFHACAFRYFMQYGLKAKTRKKAELDAPIAGDFMHFILENVTREIQNRGGFHTSIAADWRALTDRYVEEYTRLRLGDMTEKTQRFHYLFRRLKRDTYQVVEDMIEELARSEFVPLDFELSFGPEGTLPPVEFADEGIELSLRGAVDRVDGWLHDGKLYLRVVDYKTGKKSFSLSDIWYGVGMQMLLYLFALTRLGGGHFGDRPLLPGGVLYAPARDVIISASKTATPEEIEKERRKALIRSGLLLDDPEIIAAMETGEKPVFIPVSFGKDGLPGGDSLVSVEDLGRIARHIDKTILDLGREIRSGAVVPLPLGGSVWSPCLYCEFRRACHHDANVDGSRFLPKLSWEEVLEKLREAEADGAY